VGDAAVSFCVLAVTPFIAMVAIGAPALSWEDVSAAAPDPRWGTFLTVLLWCETHKRHSDCYMQTPRMLATLSLLRIAQ
jgi:hypothetical protein